VVPQGDLGAPASPSWTRSAEPKVVGEALADDAHTTTPLRGAVESRGLLCLWRIQGWSLPRVLLMLEAQLLPGTSERRPPQ
jgi:hypothetical protein